MADKTSIVYWWWQDIVPFLSWGWSFDRPRFVFYVLRVHLNL